MSYLVRLCVCVCVCVCACVRACMRVCNNLKRNRSRNAKFEYIVVYESSSDEFDIRRVKVKVAVGLQNFLPFTTIQTVRSYNSTLVQAMYVHLIKIYKIYKYCYTYKILRILRECLKLIV